MEGLVSEIDARRALRALDTRKVPDDAVGRIMTAATYAPSCANNQPWRFVAVDRQPELERVKEGLSGGNYWARQAPLIVLVLSKLDLDARLSDGRDYAFFGTGLATMNLMLQATREGLVAHPIAGFDPLVVKKNLEIPDEFTLITLIIIGHAGPEDHLSDKHKEMEHAPRQRKPESEVISRNRWFPG